MTLKYCVLALGLSSSPAIVAVLVERAQRRELREAGSSVCGAAATCSWAVIEWRREISVQVARAVSHKR